MATPPPPTQQHEHCDEAIARELAEEIGITIPDLTGFVTLDTLDADNLRPGPSSEGTRPTVQVREPSGHRGRSVVGAHLVLIRNGAVLLGKRHANSAFAPSTWHLPAGHREQGESAMGVIREAEEETGLTIAESDLSLAHTLDLLDPGSPIPRIQLFFTASRWSGEPAVLEPDRCTEWRWWPLTALPEPTVEYTRAALEAISRDTPYTAMGWT
ncbi:NUDIX hydrolase [Streptomyces avermitilis]|uniref:Nudix hydrolase domain-containing protein n=1 Tax=Streptomyces avermitilis TaxID=33903 RepID=A0A4D4M8W6_STRAX|nr:NUDIX domain-containing protein [Streptomyces avermitilis]GDY68370.1 hypothetical protein SAV14893_077630 [Streptomyces avermitilis]